MQSSFMLPKIAGLFFFSTVLLISCSPFNRLAVNTRFGKEKSYVTVYNTGIKTLTFGDFQFATNNSQFRKLHKKKAEFDNILFYATTGDPKYDYYVLLDPVIVPHSSDKYLVKDTVIENSHFVIAISRKAPKEDRDFILNEIHMQ